MNGKVTEAARTEAYDAIDRFLRNNTDDTAYAGYSTYLETLCAEPAKPEAVRLRDELRERAGLESAAREVVTLIRSIPESELLALDADKHPPSSLSEAAKTLQAALAATGKHGDESCASVEAELQFYREHIGNDLDNLLIGAAVMQVAHEGGYEACWKNTMEAVERLAATGKQQVGEVQGDWGPMTDEQVRQWIDACNSNDARQFLQAALAARRPPGQEPVATVGYKDGYRRGILNDAGKALPVGACLYAAPPAQAVDLGPFRDVALIAQQAAFTPEEKAKATRLLALIDGQA